MRSILLIFGVIAVLAAVAWWRLGQDDYEWQLPTDYPSPNVPIDNPMTAAKVELGRWLFYDTRLSGNQTMSCGT